MSISKTVHRRGWRGALASRLGALAVAGFVAMTMLPTHADAKRLGGGRSFGHQSNSVSQQYRAPATQPTRPAQQAAPAAAPATPAPQPARNRWLGPIAGLAAGLGIAALLSHFGLGGAFAGAMANLIVIAIIAFAVIWLVRRFMRRREPQPAYGAAGGAAYGRQDDAPSYGATRADGGYQTPASLGAGMGAGAGTGAFGGATAATAAAQPWGVPADFDRDAFLRNAKVHFIRLQAAWDEGNLDDIREFTTPEMFADTRVELASRGTSPNRTDVVRLDAELLGIEERNDQYIASVRYTGLIREEKDAAAEPLDEVWNLARRKGGGEGWLLAGIQQADGTAH
ncbi:Tim44 domain-containing protein [Chitinasiproducens palmae]|uniref:Predicted lipid-binding transport protein, Tim44 family n=1 Tax=Chitinasiproducens palmae TaxID=1770053 RepID=A0A1H2PNB0_9BURK|nr:Tim44-like domain-containing protein [Chitinasiproducens palmae]SDV48172.1 Predicted lipid-binding transport protein, Tim44 family [Chitinasiproducens palmae]